MYRNGSRVTLVHRGAKLSEGVKYWILPDIENRIKAGKITAHFQSNVREIRKGAVTAEGTESVHIVPADFVFVLIGYCPDTAPLRSYGVEVDANLLAPRHDPLTLETNVPGLYVAGSIVAGKNNNKIFVENGRLHGRSIVASILSRSGPTP